MKSGKSQAIINDPVTCDAITIDIQRNPMITHKNMVFSISAENPINNRNIPIYFGVRDFHSKSHIVLPQAVAANGTFSLEYPASDKFTVRVDFPSEAMVKSLALMEDCDESENFSAITKVEILHRNGSVETLPLKNGPIPPRDEPEILTSFPDEINSIAKEAWEKLSLNGNWMQVSELKKYASILNGPSQIQLFIDKLNKIEAAKSIESGRAAIPYVISKHSINPSWLLARTENYLKTLDLMFEHFSQIEVPCFLAYGTLLGALRNESFIPHDDDVDIIIDVGATSASEMHDKLHEIAASMHGGELTPRQNDHLKHLTIDTKFGGADIFSFWSDGDSAHLLMEKYQLRSMPLSILRGGNHKTVNLYDRVYSVPPKPEEFMSERYGKTWATPDPFYEWPWELTGR